MKIGSIQECQKASSWAKQIGCSDSEEELAIEKQTTEYKKACIHIEFSSTY